MNIVLTGGGSAGHIFPNLAIVNELKKYFDNIYYIGSNKPNERKIVENYNLPYFEINTPKLIRSLTYKNLFIPFKLYTSIRDCKKILKELKPDIVFSKGGYVSLPVIISANQLKIKSVIHESDVSMGLTNKICSKFCNKVCTSFPMAKANKKYIYTGAPIREEFLNPKSKRIFSNSKPTILIVGGSQGAKSINDFVYNNLKVLTSKYNIIHICGQNKKKDLKADNYIQYEFSNDMPCLIKSSDIVVTRGGSNALFEILSIGKPMIIVPLSKKESRGEQIENAKFFMQHNLGILMPSLEINSFMLTVDSQINSPQIIQTTEKHNFVQIGNTKIVDVILKTINYNQ